MATTITPRPTPDQQPDSDPLHPRDPQPLPFRRLKATQIQFFPAVIAGSLATGAFLFVYYATLGFLPRAFPGAYANYPYGPWADRFDLGQLTGTFVHPPYPSLLNWFIGVILLGGGLASAGVLYALLLSWIMDISSAEKGGAFGGALFTVIGFSLWGANGVVPPLMRAALPDPGFMFLGWTGWATIQMFICCAIYGSVLGGVYRVLQYRALTGKLDVTQMMKR